MEKSAIGTVSHLNLLQFDRLFRNTTGGGQFHPSVAGNVLGVGKYRRNEI